MDVRTWALVIRIGLQLRGNRECRRCDLAVHTAALAVVVGGHFWRGYELGVELCRDLGPDLACAVTVPRRSGLKTIGLQTSLSPPAGGVGVPGQESNRSATPWA